MNRVTTTWVWLAVVAIGVGFAIFYPNESTVMEQLPAQATQSLSRALVNLPQGLSSDDTLALLTFNRNQRSQSDSWD